MTASPTGSQVTPASPDITMQLWLPPVPHAKVASNCWPTGTESMVKLPSPSTEHPGPAVPVPPLPTTNVEHVVLEQLLAVRAFFFRPGTLAAAKWELLKL